MTQDDDQFPVNPWWVYALAFAILASMAACLTIVEHMPGPSCPPAMEEPVSWRKTLL